MDKKKYGAMIAKLYTTNAPFTPFSSWTIDAIDLSRVQEALAQVKIGDKISVKLLSDSARQKMGGKNYPDKAPVAVIEIETAEQIAEWKAKRDAKKGTPVPADPLAASAEEIEAERQEKSDF